MSEIIETIYNEFIADEKLKKGTKYERITAVVFKMLNQNDVVIHDMRLRGEGKNTPHQIDVTIEKKGVSKRILVECKEYNKVIGIGIIRDFFGAVSQIKPDEAFVVTTKGFTTYAKSFADEEQIKLAILRGFQEGDWGNKIRRIHLNVKIKHMKTPHIAWHVSNKEELEKYRNHLASTNTITEIEMISTNDYFYDENGNEVQTIKSFTDPFLRSLSANAQNSATGVHNFETTRFIKLNDYLLPVNGFQYEVVWEDDEIQTVFGEGERVALLLFKVLDGSVDSLIFDQDIENWVFDEDGEVIPKNN